MLAELKTVITDRVSEIDELLDGTKDAPVHLNCPISMVSHPLKQDLFKSPSITSSGHSYETDLLLESVRNSGGVDPMTRDKLGPNPIVKNKCLAEIVSDYCDKNLVLKPESLAEASVSIRNVNF